ncbi:MAG: ZIP family metal transporter [Patescibacteria group bacterium]
MLPIFLATGLAFLAFLGGGVLSHRFSHFLARNAGPVIAFGSGAMLAITFLHVLPEAVATAGEQTWLLVLAGILFFFTLEHFFYLHGCPDHDHPGECENHALGPLAAIGIGTHSFFDGVLIVFAFLVNPVLGWMTAIGIVLHKFPAGAILHSLICHKKDHSKKQLWWIFAVAAMTPLAAVFTPWLKNFSEQEIGFGLAFSAGTLLYITLSDLLPETHHSKNKLNLIFLLLGIFLIFAFGHFFPVE